MRRVGVPIRRLVTGFSDEFNVVCEHLAGARRSQRDELATDFAAAYPTSMSKPMVSFVDVYGPRLIATVWFGVVR